MTGSMQTELLTLKAVCGAWHVQHNNFGGVLALSTVMLRFSCVTSAAAAVNRRI